MASKKPSTPPGLGWFAPPVAPVSIKPAVSPIEEQVAGILADKRKHLQAQQAMQLAGAGPAAASDQPPVTSVGEVVQMAQAATSIATGMAELAFKKAEAAGEELKDAKAEAGDAFAAGEEKAGQVYGTVIEVLKQSHQTTLELVKQIGDAKVAVKESEYAAKAASLEAKLDALIKSKDEEIIRLSGQLQALGSKETLEQVMLQFFMTGKLPEGLEAIIKLRQPSGEMTADDLYRVGYVQRQLTREDIAIDSERLKQHQQAETGKQVQELVKTLTGLLGRAHEVIPVLVTPPGGPGLVNGIAADFPQG